MRSFVLSVSIAAFAGIGALASCIDDDCTRTATCPIVEGGGGTTSAGGEGGTGTGASGGGGTSSGGGGTGGEGGNLGQPCDTPGECDSGFCVDGLCCDNACDATCQSCALAGLEGACTPIPPAEDPDAECGSGLCDGSGSCAIGGHLWSNRFGDSQLQEAQGVAVDASGNIIITGYLMGATNFGCGALTATGSTFDVYVAKFDGNGNCLWSNTYGGSGFEIAYDVAVDTSGNIFVTGWFDDTLTFGGTTMTTSGQKDHFLAKLSPSGAYLWQRKIGDTANQGSETPALAVDAAGNVALAFQAPGSFSLGGSVGNIAGAGGDDVWVVGFAANTGSAQWANRFGDGANQQLRDLAYTMDGDLALVGHFDGAIDFGLNQYVNSGGTNSHDAYLAVLDAMGQEKWSISYAGTVRAQSVACDKSGNLVVGGNFTGQTDFGGGVESGSPNTIYVAKVDSQGSYLWSRVITGTGAVLELAVDESASIVLGGVVQSIVDFGGGSLPYAGGNDAYLAKLSASGTHLWSDTFGDATNQQIYGLDLVGGDAVIAGPFQGTVDFGGTSLVDAGSNDIFLARFGP